MTDEHSADVKNLRLLETFFIPLSPEEAAERRRIVTEAGAIDAATIIRALGGEPTEGLRTGAREAR